MLKSNKKGGSEIGCWPIPLPPFPIDQVILYFGFAQSLVERADEAERLLRHIVVQPGD